MGNAVMLCITIGIYCIRFKCDERGSLRATTERHVPATAFRGQHRNGPRVTPCRAGPSNSWYWNFSTSKDLVTVYKYQGLVVGTC
jgi:hypothetical protein